MKLDHQESEDLDDPMNANRNYLMAMDIATGLADILWSERTVTPGLRQVVRSLTGADQREQFVQFVVRRVVQNGNRGFPRVADASTKQSCKLERTTSTLDRSEDRAGEATSGPARKERRTCEAP